MRISKASLKTCGETPLQPPEPEQVRDGEQFDRFTESGEGYKSFDSARQVFSAGSEHCS